MRSLKYSPLITGIGIMLTTYLEQVSEEVERALAKLGPAMLNGRLVALF